MSRLNTGDARQTVCFRLGKAQLKLLDAYSEQFKQGKGDLIREAVQSWLNKQIKSRGLPDGDK
jgi:hypothetical protein